MQAEKRADFGRQVKRNVSDNFDQSVAVYQAFEERHHFFARLTLQLAAFIDLQPDSSVLDVGCGTGISARTLHERFSCRVLGVDLSPRMVNAGVALTHTDRIRLVVGDGEQLTAVTTDRDFDYALYNASIFIFPDVDQALQQAMACLRPNGLIAFTFYPDIVTAEGLDLLTEAFRRIDQPEPRLRVITDYPQACLALEKWVGPVRRGCWTQNLDATFLKDFFTIPAQSASLFPGRPYPERKALVDRLCNALTDGGSQAKVIWKMAQARKRS